MRSNDLNWGTPYDIAAFTCIQCQMASCLGISVGKYHHSVGSLHYYNATIPTVAADGPQHGPRTKNAIEQNKLQHSLHIDKSRDWFTVASEADKMLRRLWNAYNMGDNKKLLFKNAGDTSWTYIFNNETEWSPWLIQLFELSQHVRSV